MSRFFDLFTRSVVPPAGAPRPRGGEDEFPRLVEAGPLRLWRPGDSVPSEGTWLLIGVATWSGYDMRLLDVVAERINGHPRQHPSVNVFDTAECEKPNDLRKYTPTIRHVFHTPVAGVWLGGRLVDAKEGHAARELVAAAFGSTSDEIVDYVQRWVQSRETAKGA